MKRRVGSMQAPRLTVPGEERTRLAQARLGQRVLGRWRLERLIGVGGMAAVFEASPQNGGRVAIKILHLDLCGFDDIRERFLAESYIANRVSHPGVVSVRDEGTTDDGAMFLVMDLLQGQTLAERLQPGGEPLSVGEVLEIASQLLDVLVHAHDRGIVHRDIKPENVFLTRDGRVRLLDFGVARVASLSHQHPVEVGSTLGTPAFMPPEQALGRLADLDGRGDLWSLGATMYLLLSGVPVRETGSTTELLLSAMTRPIVSLGEVAALPRSVVAVVDRALAFDRDERFPDARSMQLAVRAALDELSVPDSRATLPPPSIEPVALSLRTPRSGVRSRALPARSSARPQTPAYGSVRPVSSTATPLPTAGARPGRSALPLYIALGFALGIGIVVTARLNVESAQDAAVLPERTPVVLLPDPALVAAPAPTPSAALAGSAGVPVPSASASAAASFKRR